MVEKNNSGLTLIQLIIVVGGMFFLTYLLLQVVNPIKSLYAGNDDKRKQDLIILSQAIEKERLIVGKYPRSSNKYQIEDLNGSPLEWGQSPATLNKAFPYLKDLPKDSNNSKRYVYYSSPDGQFYWLYASLDNREDSMLCNSGNPCASLRQNNIANDQCGGICNYGISSGNTSL